MNNTGSKFTSLIGGLLAKKAQASSMTIEEVPQASRVTKAEIQEMLDLNPFQGDVPNSLAASEQMLRKALA